MDAARTGSRFEGPRVRRLVAWGAVAALGLLAAYSLFQFYHFASVAVDRWVGEQFRATFQAAFNLAVLLASAAGIAALVRRTHLGDDHRGDARRE